MQPWRNNRCRISPCHRRLRPPRRRRCKGRSIPRAAWSRCAPGQSRRQARRHAPLPRPQSRRLSRPRSRQRPRRPARVLEHPQRARLRRPQRDPIKPRLRHRDPHLLRRRRRRSYLLFSRPTGPRQFPHHRPLRISGRGWSRAILPARSKPIPTQAEARTGCTVCWAYLPLPRLACSHGAGRNQPSRCRRSNGL